MSPAKHGGASKRGIIFTAAEGIIVKNIYTDKVKTQFNKIIPPQTRHNPYAPSTGWLQSPSVINRLFHF